MLQKLQANWPRVEVTVRNQRRLDAKTLEDQVVDRALVSTAYSLDYRVYEAPQGLSEWTLITRLLERNTSIRKLRLQPNKSWSTTANEIMPEDAPSGLPRLALTPGTRLPPLEEFSLADSHSWYAWDRDHSLQLSNCMDWAYMRKLDFESDYPLHLFSALVGRVPNLTALRFGFPTRAETPEPAVSLLKSTTLTELDIDNIHTYVIELWPAIRTHRNSLQTLILRPSKREQSYELDPPLFLDVNYIKEIAEKFCSISRLGFSLPFQGENWYQSTHPSEVCITTNASL